MPELDEELWIHGDGSRVARIMTIAILERERIDAPDHFDAQWSRLQKAAGLESEYGPRQACSDAISDGAITPEMIRDIFGNPFNPLVRVNRRDVHLGRCTPDLTSAGPWRGWHESWVTQDAMNCARALVADEKQHLDPVGLKMLADALEDAQCSLTDVLDHLRSPGIHYHGCWAVHLVLDS